MFEASNLLSKLTETLYKNGDMNKKISSKNIEIYMRKNFTHCWKLFFDMQIPLILNWKKFFKDIETWHIWGIIATQKSFINNLICIIFSYVPLKVDLKSINSSKFNNYIWKNI